MLEHDSQWLERLDEFVDLFRDDFRRRDQIRWAAVYLQGLLLDGGVKTIGNLARRVLLPPDLLVDDVAQALQNFVNQSPWDERKLWRRHRQMQSGVQAASGSVVDPSGGVFVLEDLAFVKQGRHSVGVQRQYSGVLGRKTNCQIAIALYHVAGVREEGTTPPGKGQPKGPASSSLTPDTRYPTPVLPLALRLYLPRTWLQSPSRLQEAGVPEEYRLPQTRGGIAVELLDQVRADGWNAQTLVVGSGLGTDLAFREALLQRGLHYLIETSPEQVALPDESIWLPEGEEKRRAILTNVPLPLREVHSRQQAFCQPLVSSARRHLMEDLGMDHFEGRSWRGFHHHACLVVLAYSFRLFQTELLRYSHSSML